MIDREKVINGLNTDVLPFLQHYCDMQCDREKRWISKMIITVHDTLAMLKEQEAVEPTWNRGKPFCGACGLRIHGSKFCSECGRPILWEGR